MCESASTFAGTRSGCARGAQAPPSVQSALSLPLHVAHRCLRPHAAAAACESVGSVHLPLTIDGAAREGLPVIGPVAERITVPWRLRRDRRKLQLLPDRTRALHELT